MEYYWKKKTIVSFVLAILVSMIHLEVSREYIKLESANGGGGYS